MSSGPQKSISVTAVKGHLVNKSSPLATDSCKLEKQFITAQNMASHYKRVINAKSSIDTSAPKSLTKSVKVQDRVKREILQHSWANKDVERAKSVDTPRSITEEKSESKSLTTVSRTLKSEDIKPRVLPDQHKLNKSMSNMVNNFTKRNSNRVTTYRPKDSEDIENKTQFINPLASSDNISNQEKLAKNMMTTIFFNSNNHNSSGILNPALKAMSRLVSGHNYDYLEKHADRFKQPTHEFQPRIKNKENSSSKLKESNCYEPPRRNKKTNLAKKNKFLESTHISDEEIETKTANISKLNKSKVNESVDDDYEDFGFNLVETNREKLNNSNILNVSSSSRKLTTSQTNLKRAAEKEEQLKYLEFIKDVTDDILQRNLTTDRVIRNCFNYHLKKNKNRLDEKKMLELLDTLREDIGIPKDDDAEVGTNYYNTVNKAILLDKERNKENFDEPDTEYLTLRKFGYTSINTSRSLNMNNENEAKADLNTSHSSQVSQTKKKFDDYENQIMKNIQTIRRKSTDSNEADKVPSRKNSNDSQKSFPPSPKHGSILKKSPSQSSEMSRKNSLDSKDDFKPKITKVYSQESIQKKSEINNIQDEDDDDDDDDDLFIGSNYNSKPASLNGSRRNSLVKASFSKEDFEDQDALFNDNYNGPEKSDDSENDDNFDELIKTKTFKRGNLRKKSTESNGSDFNEKSPIPTPRPRISRTYDTKATNETDEDDF